MKSLNPGEYAAQPRLLPPAGYICVLRDVASDKWRIEGARHPQTLVEGVLAEGESRFGVELVSILKTDDLAASGAELYERHHAGLSDAWLSLDEYQLEALRRSMLKIDAHPSHYLALKEVGQSTASVNKGSGGRRMLSQRRPDRWGFPKSDGPRQPLYRLYGAKSLKDYKEPEPRDWRQDLDSPERWLLKTSERLARFRESDAGKALQVVLFLLFIAIMCVSDGFG